MGKDSSVIVTILLNMVVYLPLEAYKRQPGDGYQETGVEDKEEGRDRRQVSITMYDGSLTYEPT